MINSKSEKLETVVRELTVPVKGQYPRPWMTDAIDPASSEVFVVGYNQSKTFPESSISSHNAFLDSLFNRGQESCRVLYDRVAGSASRTRQVTDQLVNTFARFQIRNVIQTNVICYSTPRAANARTPDHSQGLKQGTDLFKALVAIIQPRVIVVHGSATRKEMEAALKLTPAIPAAPRQMSEPVFQQYLNTRVYPIQSLSGAPFNSWKPWAFRYFEVLAEDAAAYLNGERTPNPT